MSDELTKMLIGRVPSGGSAWKQISATAELAVPVYCFIPVGEDATMTTIESNGVDMSGDSDNGVYYQGIPYTGNYTKLKPATGRIICYLGKNK